MDEYRQFSAKTKGEAITQACIEMGTTSDQLDIQVISEGSSGFFGIGSKPAVIRVRKIVISSDEVDIKNIIENVSLESVKGSRKEKSQKKDKQEKPKQEKSKQEKTKQEKPKQEKPKQEKPVQEKQVQEDNNTEKDIPENEKAVNADIPEKPVKEPVISPEEGIEKEPENQEQSQKPRRERRRRQRNQKERREESNQESENSEGTQEKPVRQSRPVEIITDEEEIKVIEEKAAAFLKEIFDSIDLGEVEIKSAYNREDGSLEVDFEGEDMGILIGKRGQTLDSLQYLTSLVVNKDRDKYVRVKLDTEDYRRRRKETLENLARGIANNVRKTRKSVVLEPMNPYERRIIHSVLQSNRFVETVSEGEEPYRHIVVKYKRY